MNAYKWSFPATEALNREMKRGMPRRKRTSSHLSRNTRSPQRNVSGLMDTDSDTLAFPRIEWTLDDNESEYIVTKEGNSSSSHHSAPTIMLGGGNKKTRRDHHHRRSRLVRSMSLKSSMCFLVDQSASCSRRTSLCMARDGSWGQFISDDGDDDEDNMALYKMSLSDHSDDDASQIGVVNLVGMNLSPFLVY